MFHRHKWGIVAAKPANFKTVFYCTTDNLVCYKTRVLRKCSICSELRVELIDGTWTLEEVKDGKSS